MPTYVFKEKGKRKLIEVQMKISELDSFKLNNPKLKQIPTAPSFRLKGTGWYETDFKTGKRKNLAKNDEDKQGNLSKTKTETENKIKKDEVKKKEEKSESS
jgi:predicted nucleic acid-binding Zn ribbon protein